MRTRELYEIHAEPDAGFSLPDGQPWKGYRIRYRVAGTRGRWSRFLLTMEPDRPPTIEELQLVCARHAEGRQ